MKIFKIGLFVLSLSFVNAWARRGEHDGADHEDDGRIISCLDKNTQKNVLEFQSSSLESKYSNEVFDLNVKARGDDIAEIKILDKRSGDSVKVKRLEELLKVTLTSDESKDPLVLETDTHRGYAEMVLNDPNSLDSVTVKSQSRKGTKFMEVTLVTDELKGTSELPLSVLCESK